MLDAHPLSNHVVGTSLTTTNLSCPRCPMLHTYTSLNSMLITSIGATSLPISRPMPPTNTPIPNQITTPPRRTYFNFLLGTMFGAHAAHLCVVGTIGCGAAFDFGTVFHAEGVVHDLVGAAGGVGQIAL